MFRRRYVAIIGPAPLEKYIISTPVISIHAYVHRIVYPVPRQYIMLISDVKFCARIDIGCQIWRIFESAKLWEREVKKILRNPLRLLQELDDAVVSEYIIDLVRLVKGEIEHVTRPVISRVKTGNRLLNKILKGQYVEVERKIESIGKKDRTHEKLAETSQAN